MKMQINRLLEIVYILLSKKTVTAKELAGRFGVSQRTIYRDIDALSLAGIPVYTEKGKGGGISLLPGFVLNKSILSEGEQQEILSALQGLSAVSAAQTDNVLQKLSALFNTNSIGWIDVDFSDGYIVSDEERRADDLRDVQNFLMQPWEYRKRWYGETEDVAKKMVQIQGTMFGNNKYPPGEDE